MAAMRKTGLLQATPKWLDSRAADLKKVFVQVVHDLNEVVVLDSISRSPDLPTFRILTHDARGPLPAMYVEDSGEWEHIVQRIQGEAAKLAAIARIRLDLVNLSPQCYFLPPTLLDGGVLVGVIFPGKTLLVEGPTYCAAYQELKKRALATE